MRRRGLHQVAGTAVLLAVFVLLASVSTASADVVQLKVKEGRTVIDPGSKTVIADQNTVVSAPYTWLLTRDVTGTPNDSITDCRPAQGLTVPSDVLKANGGNHSDPAYLDAVAAMTAAYANYPENCDWPSIHAIQAGTTPSVVMTGDQSDWSLLQGVSDLPKGKYMVSVWAEGYEVAGGWFTVACGPRDTGCDPAAEQTALVYAQRNPIPTATLRIDVFEDVLPTNGQYDVGSEVGLNDFSAVAIDPGTGEALTTDVYGNPICSDYEPIRTRAGSFGPGQPVVDADGLTIYQLYNGAGDPVFDSFTAAGQPIVGAHTGWETATPKLLPGTGGKCLSRSLRLTDPETGDPYTDPGHIVIRNLGPGRWAAMVSPPNNGNWANDPRNYDPEWSQTTTLEGAHDWDSWINAGDNGLDHELVNGTEKAAITVSGWVRKQDSLPVAHAPGSIHGNVVEAFSYTGDPVNGNYVGQNEQSMQKEAGPVRELWVALTALHVPANVLTPGQPVPAQDETVWAKSFYEKNPGNTLRPGEFDIPSVPAGDYMMTVWDFDQNNILHSQNVTVRPGEQTDLDTIRLAQWWTWIHGTVFTDTNGNGKQDAGEKGIPNQLLTVRERSNALYLHGSNVTTTDANGNYQLRAVYPLGQWLTLEQYSDGYKTTGLTWQAAHEKSPTTRLGGAVDVNFLPWIGQGATIDWGKQPYSSAENGGIVGVVSYGTTRNELNPDEAVIEAWQTGIAGLPMHIYRPVRDATGDLVHNPDGSVQVEGQQAGGPGTPTDIGPQYTTEQWNRPVDCQSFDAEGDRTSYPFMADYALFTAGLPLAVGANHHDCVEAIGGGMKIGEIADGANTNWGATLNGNWAFAKQYRNPNLPAGGGPGQLDDPANLEPLAHGDYVVKVDLPKDARGKDIYKVTGEENINVFTGDSVQQPKPNILKYGCAGANHTVDVAGILPDGPGAVANPAFAKQGGSPYEGQAKPRCDAKLIHLENGRSVAPSFELFTDTPLPTIQYGLIIDDLNTSVNKEEIFYGDKVPAQGMPISWYDWSGRLVRQSVTDPNGFYEAMLPSTNRINYPSPAGVSPGSYTLVANDPSMTDPTVPDPGAANLNPRPAVPNPDFDPQYRTISTPFEAWPGHTTITDLALSPIGVAVNGPGAQLSHPAKCLLDATETPQLFAANRVSATRPSDVTGWTDGDRTFTLTGTGFGAGATVSLVNEDPVVNGVGTAITAPAPTYGVRTASSITFTLSTDTLSGPYQVYITNNVSRQLAVNVLTLHVLGNGPGAYNPTVYEVGPGKTFDPALAPLTGSVTSATTNTLTSSAVNFTGTTDLRVTITSGRGTGQVRQIQSVLGAPGNDQIRVSQNWSLNQTPDATSTFAIVRARGIQDAINASIGLDPQLPTVGDEGEDAGQVDLTSRPRLIVVYPNGAGATGFNPRGAYQENLIVPVPMTIQGVGPGGQGPSGYVYGSVVDGSTFQVKDGGAYQTSWYALAQQVADAAQNPTQISDGEVIYVLTRSGLFGQGDNPARAGIDGLAIEGGDQMSFPGGLNLNGGGPVPRRLQQLGQPVTQGGGIYIDGHARRFQIKNNVFRSDGGSYGGAIRLGSPYLGQDGNASNDNANIKIANNQIIASGGTNLAGGVAIFNGADNYEIARNEICGNFSAEYGGGISHFGRSNGGRIHHNRIYFNASYDEGGGIMVAGQLPSPKNFPNLPVAAGRTHGSGAVTIEANVIQSNLSNDDGGGIRLLMAGTDPIRITNNQIVNNISTHEGGGIAIDDATDVTVAGNTVMKNITTATAMTSDGTPAPAGLSTAENSLWLTMPPANDTCPAPINGTSNVPTFPTCIPVQAVFTPPVVFDNIFWDNRAGSYNNGFVHGIGLPGDSQPVRQWDLAASGVAAGNTLKPVKNDIQDLTGHTDYDNRGNVSVDPKVQSAYDTTVRLSPFRGDPHFVGGTIVAVDLPPTRMGNYKLSSTSPTGDAVGVIDNGVRCIRVTATDPVAAPLCDAQANTKLVQLEAYDIDNDARPQGPAYDMGSDEYLAATAPNVTVLLIASRISVTASVTASRVVPPARSVVGGKAPESISTTCKTCTAALQYRKGKHGRVQSLRMRSSKNRFTVRTRTLAPGTYRYRVVIRNRQTHRVHTSAWRTLVIKKHPKGTR